MKNGFININKAVGMTSHDVVNRVRKIFNTKKVGHAGTLDPFATGVLPIAVGRATKFLEYLSDCDKSYRAEIFFGVETSTGDITGKVLKKLTYQPKMLDEVDKVLSSFIGTIQQTPPKYSAIKVNGRKAYELARKNVDFELPSREVKIYSLKVVSMTEDTVTVDVDCSKGTYIRSLAVDIGRRLGVPATLKNLQRTRARTFSINNSVTLENLQNIDEAAVINVDTCLTHLPRYDLPERRLKAFCSGLTTRINENFAEGALFRVYVGDDYIGVGKILDSELKADKVLVDGELKWT